MQTTKIEPECVHLEFHDVVVHPTYNGWIVTKIIHYKDVTIPQGYFTNGANIPRLLWRVISPHDPSIFNGVVVHDFLCDNSDYRTADDYFECILVASDIPKWKRKSIIAGVRTYTKWGRKASRIW